MKSLDANEGSSARFLRPGPPSLDRAGLVPGQCHGHSHHGHSHRAAFRGLFVNATVPGTGYLVNGGCWRGTEGTERKRQSDGAKKAQSETGRDVGRRAGANPMQRAAKAVAAPVSELQPSVSHRILVSRWVTAREERVRLAGYGGPLFHRRPFLGDGSHLIVPTGLAKPALEALKVENCNSRVTQHQSDIGTPMNDKLRFSSHCGSG